MTLETKRLFLRPWRETDAENLYKSASDPDVGPVAGWPPHRNVEESLYVIKNVLSGQECYCICLKEEGADTVVGCIELKLNGHTNMTEQDDECELGYWLGKPFWGNGLMPEAAGEMLRHAFKDLGMKKVWCGYYDGNDKSKRVQEKIGFRYQRTMENVDVPLMHERRTEHVTGISKEEWIRREQA
ncbi:MAG: GNAT family N-acetyltransferase [Acetatifactor sp.]|nr:GNAT family N-acetyltransferase [Acetatifactor sp.]